MLMAGQVQAGLWDTINKVLQSGASPPTGKNISEELSSKEIAQGLIEALQVGSERAVNKASAAGGFFNDPLIHIPLPEKLLTIGNGLRRIGLGGQVDVFEKTLNTAAEKASKEALPILGGAIRSMTIEDAKRLWKGSETSLTEYFEKKTRQTIYEKYKPIVHETAQEVGVTHAYEAMVNAPAVKTLAGGTDLDLDHYVTEKALDGLFHLLGEEERQIRANPVARTTDLLKKVFGN